MNKLQLASSLLATALVCAVPGVAGDYTFQTVNNPGDPNFNQLLGINNSGTIAGYFGDGNTVPNNGYTVASPYKTFTPENFPGSAQTQVVGINSNATPTTVGFWVDGTGNNFGFVNQGGAFTTVANPGGASFNQLLGVNNSGIAAGFYTASGNNFGYTYNIGTQTFSPVNDPNGTSSTATGINNSGVVSGFYTDAAGNTHGFLDISGVYHSYDDPSGNGMDTMFFGLNNKGQVVGSYMDAGGNTEGLVFNYMTNTWQTVDDPNASNTAAFGVAGTTINGINDLGQVVGFYSDGTNVDGFVASVPEPGSIALISAGLFGLAFLRRRKAA